MAKRPKRMQDELDLRTAALAQAVATLDQLTVNPFWSPRMSGPVHAAARQVVAAFAAAQTAASEAGQLDKGTPKG
jgi:hypothetical protein